MYPVLFPTPHSFCYRTALSQRGFPHLPACSDHSCETKDVQVRRKGRKRGRRGWKNKPARHCGRRIVEGLQMQLESPRPLARAGLQRTPCQRLLQFHEAPRMDPGALSAIKRCSLCPKQRRHQRTTLILSIRGRTYIWDSSCLCTKTPLPLLHHIRFSR